LRILQKAIAEDITTRVHGAEALQAAISASNILFGKSTSDDLKSLSEKDFFSVFEGVPQATISREEFGDGISIVEAMAAKTNFLASNGEARRELKANAIAVNKEKVTESFVITAEHLINNKYVLLGKGKKNNYILVVE
jgi:tyrosyl-tRNA synthetase